MSSTKSKDRIHEIKIFGRSSFVSPAAMLVQTSPVTDPQ